MASRHKSTRSTEITKPEPVPLAAGSPPAFALPDAQADAESLEALAKRIANTLRALEGASAGDVRAGCLAVEADLLRLGIRAVNVRGTVAALGQSAYLAELAALSSEVRQ